MSNFHVTVVAVCQTMLYTLCMIDDESCVIDNITNIIIS